MKTKNIFISLLFIATLCACSSGKSKFPIERIHIEEQASYLAGPYNMMFQYAGGTSEKSRPYPVEIEVKKEGMYDSYSYTLTKDVDDSLCYSGVVKDEEYLEFYNLEIGEAYTFKGYSPSEVAEPTANKRLNVEHVNDPVQTYTFTVEDVAPRNLYVDGVTNCRDLGGWKIGKSKRVRQGLIYRTAKLNEDGSDTPLITEKGISTMKNFLNVKTELDLRKTNDYESGGITSSPLGDGVKYVSIPMKSSGNIMTLNKGLLPELFNTLGDAKNYPLFFHCSIGTDRTGYVAFLINALLGVSEEDLIRDYLFSNFADIGSMRTSSTLEGYIKDIKDMAKGKTLAEKVENYLLDNKVSKENIENIKNNLTQSI